MIYTCTYLRRRKLMSRNTGPTWRLSRRLNFSVLETGEELAKRPYIPGQHGSATRRIKQSNYGLQKAEKQKLRHMYGLSEKQFYNTYVKAVRMKGVTGTNLFIMMESRLDNLVYRMGFASTRKQARQIVCHGHILVNGKKVDIPSCQIKPGSVIEVKDNYKNNQFVAESLEATASFKDFVEGTRTPAKASTSDTLKEKNSIRRSTNCSSSNITTGNNHPGNKHRQKRCFFYAIMQE